MVDICKSSLFYSDQQLCYAEILPPSQVRARIEVAVLNFLKILSSPTPSITDLSLITRRSSNSQVSRGLLTDVSSIFLSYSYCTRSLSKANATKAFIRVWKVMEMCLQLLVQGKMVTQRELFYKLLCTSSDYFTSQLQVNRTIQDVVALLRCSRHSLGIMASSRGAVAGRLVLQHAIFQRLAEDRIFNQIPSILITAKGYPDIATRNPAGLAILCTFKFGSIGMGLEAYRYACNVKWLGLRGDDLQLIPEESLVPLKPRDLQIAKSLMSSDILQEPYRKELALMVQSSQRAEIEALYVHGYDFLGKYIARKIVQADYI
ncbi:hypothetical protein GIB67_037171 [Kingdonia uniflora]|uniref:DNA topoisomerase (ATP-hydrolyzing) n=1 Tax=Kingdonia uniflora TaxID=39325 RepID=A0A7J7MSC8_9MAGN|nr:hypothetical protein GIB67_037171 [Kingdonia uniflora]